jgi:hypothetical protein
LTDESRLRAKAEACPPLSISVAAGTAQARLCPPIDPVRAAAQHQDKSNDLIQTDFNFPVQACGIRTADKRP